MLYKITNYTIIKGVSYDSELMEYDRALEEFNIIQRQAIRGFRPFSELLDENNNLIMN